jgi:hypothetical protein
MVEINILYLSTLFCLFSFHAFPRLSTLNETLPIACHIKKRQTQIEAWLCDVEAELNLLGDIPSQENLEQLRLYQQSVYVSIHCTYPSSFNMLLLNCFGR